MFCVLQCKIHPQQIVIVWGKLKFGREIDLKDVGYVPDLNGELISVKQIQKSGHIVVFEDHKVFVKT